MPWHNGLGVMMMMMMKKKKYVYILCDHIFFSFFIYISPLASHSSSCIAASADSMENYYYCDYY